MKKILIILFLIIFSILPSYSKDRLNLSDFGRLDTLEKNIYQQYLDDIKYIIEINLDKEKLEEYRKENKITYINTYFLATIKSDGTIKKIERVYGGPDDYILQDENTGLHKILYEPIEKYGFNPFYYGMNVDEVKILIRLVVSDEHLLEDKDLSVNYSNKVQGIVPRCFKAAGKFSLLLVGGIPMVIILVTAMAYGG